MISHLLTFARSRINAYLGSLMNVDENNNFMFDRYYNIYSKKPLLVYFIL